MKDLITNFVVNFLNRNEQTLSLLNIGDGHFDMKGKFRIPKDGKWHKHTLVTEFYFNSSGNRTFQKVSHHQDGQLVAQYEL